ncbi:MAG: copper amine oxidase N-terminal domain-containing protein [Cellulosilyticaceae bacterium]
MKKVYLALGLMVCMSATRVGLVAKEVVAVPISAPVQAQDVVSVHQINMNVPITRAEMIIAIVQATGEQLPMIMDTHYALPAMEKAEQLGLIDLKQYPMETWSQVMTNEEKSTLLSKAMANKSIDMEKVYTALSQLLVEHVTVDGKPVDLGGLTVSHYNGKLMLPLRPIAEAMGFKVTWDPSTYSATLNNGTIQSVVQVGYDMYNYSSVKAIGMSAPFSAGAAPRLIDGVVYVPAAYFGMFADYEISDSTIQFQMK